MRTLAYSLTTAALAAALLGLGAFASAQANEHEGGKAEVQDLSKLQQVAPLDQLITKALTKVPGRVYGVEFEDWPEQAHERQGMGEGESEGMENEANERHAYEIQILGHDNKLHGVAYDAMTGKYLGEHNEASEDEGEY